MEATLFRTQFQQRNVIEKTVTLAIGTLICTVFACGATGCYNPESGHDNSTPWVSQAGTLESPFAEDASTLGKLKLVASSEEEPADESSGSSAVIGVNGIEIRSIEGQYYRFQVERFELDLLSLDTSLSTVLARAKIPAGRYDHVRLVTDAEGVVTGSDGATIPMTVPSGEQSGLKIFFEPAIEIVPEELTVAAFTFDVSRSLVLNQGGSQYNFKPVIRVGVTQVDLDDVDGGIGDDTGTGDGSGGSDDGSTDGSSDGSTDGSAGGSTDDGTGGLVDEDDYNDDNFTGVIGV